MPQCPETGRHRRPTASITTSASAVSTRLPLVASGSHDFTSTISCSTAATGQRRPHAHRQRPIHARARMQVPANSPSAALIAEKQDEFGVAAHTCFGSARGLCGFRYQPEGATAAIGPKEQSPPVDSRTRCDQTRRQRSGGGAGSERSGMRRFRVGAVPAGVVLLLVPAPLP